MIFANFIVVFVCFHVFDASQFFAESYAWMVLLAATLAMALSAIGAMSYMPKGFVKTFYKHLTYRDYLDSFNWNRQKFSIDHKRRELIDDQDGVRALIPTWASPTYAPRAKLVKFYGENWARWCDDKPFWFDSDFKALVPRDLLVEVDQEILRNDPEFDQAF